ncbi:DNRLRE domain-containing protein [Nitriliruptoraceae bacterium ZYF776]|nr:DNRLRE domain-containing protein [Profundirhabdus halotolerans]
MGSGSSCPDGAGAGRVGGGVVAGGGFGGAGAGAGGFEVGAVNRAVEGVEPAGRPSAEGEVVEEVEELRTSHSTTWRLGDGSFVTEASMSAVHYEAADGGLVPVPRQLTATSEGWEIDYGRDGRVELPERLGDGPARTWVGQDALVELTLLDAAGDRGVTSGTEVLYMGVLPGVDVRHRVGPGTVKDDLILAGPDAARQFSYRLEVSGGLEPAEVDGRIELRAGEDGEVVATLAAPAMFDASGPESITDAIDLGLTADGEGWVLEVTPDAAWLDEPERVWPVTVDPTTSWGPATNCGIASQRQTTSYCDLDLLRVGSDSAGQWRTLLDFQMWNDMPFLGRGAPVTVRNAELGLAILDEYNHDPDLATTIHRVQTDFDGTATWQRASTGTPWSTPGGDYRDRAVERASTGVGYDPCTEGIWRADPGFRYWYLTDELRQWFNGDVNERGLLLKARDEPVDVRTVYASSGHPDWELHPRLRVQWHRSIGDRKAATSVDWRLTEMESHRPPWPCGGSREVVPARDRSTVGSPVGRGGDPSTMDAAPSPSCRGTSRRRSGDRRSSSGRGCRTGQRSRGGAREAAETPEAEWARGRAHHPGDELAGRDRVLIDAGEPAFAALRHALDPAASPPTGGTEVTLGAPAQVGTLGATPRSRCSSARPSSSVPRPRCPSSSSAATTAARICRCWSGSPCPRRSSRRR